MFDLLTHRANAMQTAIQGLGCVTLLRPSRRASLCVRAQQPASQQAGKPVCHEGPAIRASSIPTPDEDREVAHSAFMNAFKSAQPERLRIHGMQEFAGALLARSRIPSQQYVDPLMHIFDEFDVDRDGHLSAVEVAAALQSRDVNISPDQAQMFIETVDLNSNNTVERGEFRDLILHMAAADLHSRKEEFAELQVDVSWDTSSWEEDEEIQKRLQSWVDTLLVEKRKNKNNNK